MEHMRPSPNMKLFSTIMVHNKDVTMFFPYFFPHFMALHLDTGHDIRIALWWHFGHFYYIAFSIKWWKMIGPLLISASPHIYKHLSNAFCFRQTTFIIALLLSYISKWRNKDRKDLEHSCQFVENGHFNWSDLMSVEKNFGLISKA